MVNIALVYVCDHSHYVRLLVRIIGLNNGYTVAGENNRANF